MMYIVMIIKTKYFSGYFGFLHVFSSGNDGVVVISPDGKPVICDVFVFGFLYLCCKE
jgi:hypothetical protein